MNEPRREHLNVVGTVAAAVVFLACGAAGPARGIINPRFTPSDLVRASSQIYELELRLPEGDALEGTVTATLKGDAPAEKAIAFGLTVSEELALEEVAAAFGPRKRAVGVLLLSAEGGSGDAPAGFLQINTLWYTVNGDGAQRWLSPDRQDMFAVWAGTARMLAEAVRYVTADPAAAFPVMSRIRWDRDVALGNVGKVRGCLPVDFGGKPGPCAIVFGADGDRVFKLGGAGAPPEDVTKHVKLTTASVLVAPGDFDGDGRTDLVCWDGAKLRLAVQTPEGAFAERAVAAAIDGCLSLDAVDAGGGPASGCVAGTPGGPVLLTADGERGFAARPLAAIPATGAAADLGQGGVSAVADFDDDGRVDVLACFERGTALYPGRQEGGFGAAIVTATRLVKRPSLIVCGDYDADGKLDVIVGGDDGLVLLSRGESERLVDYTHATGEFTYHGNANRRRVVAVSAADINNDARQGAAVFYAEGVPLVFFNRGFACFGMARELHLAGGEMGGEVPGMDARVELKASGALQRGQASGMFWDLDGDSVQDMLAVTPDGEAWALFGGVGGDRPLGVIIAAPAAKGPLTVTVSDARRRLGMHVVRPGGSVFVGREHPGPLTLRWKDADGKPHEKRVVVMKSVRVDL